MAIEECFSGICFIALDPNGPKLFGFSEFLAGLALMVLTWTIADTRYRFRVRTAPIPLQGITYAIIAAVGSLALMTDLWRVQGWRVPSGSVLTPASWQALLAGIFLLTFLTWTWFAFIRPPTFGRLNAARFARTLYRHILKGDPSELAVVADELTHSAKPLVGYATNRGIEKYRGAAEGESERQPPRPTVELFANDLLLLIADRRLCRAIVASSPGTALAIFKEVGRTKKYGVQVEVFAKNIINEALMNRDSFLYHEAEGYESGLLGYHKPLSQALFANYHMVETIGTLLDPDIHSDSKWDAEQWTAYCRVVLLVFQSYVTEQCWSHSFSLYRAKGYIQGAVSDLYKLNGVANVEWTSDVTSRLRVVVRFIRDAVAILDKQGVPAGLRLRDRDAKGINGNKSFFDYLATMILEIIDDAAAVRGPPDHCWWIQHNSVWGELFNFERLSGPAGRVVKFKARRLIFNAIVEMNRFPNFQAARILGFCLNVMGLTLRKEAHDRDSRALHKVVLEWTKRHYAWLRQYNSEIAEACLVDSMHYESKRHRIVKTYPAKGLRREAAHVYLEVDRRQQAPRPQVRHFPPEIDVFAMKGH